MKVKKVLSLVLAVVMVFTLIPAQLIASSGLDSKIGNAVTNKIDVSIAGEEAGKYAGCIDVALKLSVHGYLSLAEGTERQITMGNQIIKFDPTVLSTVIKTPPTKRGQPNMQTVLDAIEASPNKNLPRQCRLMKVLPAVTLHSLYPVPVVSVTAPNPAKYSSCSTVCVQTATKIGMKWMILKSPLYIFT